jgi:hypothetical protein
MSHWDGGPHVESFPCDSELIGRRRVVIFDCGRIVDATQHSYVLAHLDLRSGDNARASPEAGAQHRTTSDATVPDWGGLLEPNGTVRKGCSSGCSPENCTTSQWTIWTARHEPFRSSRHQCDTCNVPAQSSKACEVQASVGSNPTATALETASDLRKCRTGAVLLSGQLKRVQLVQKSGLQPQLQPDPVQHAARAAQSTLKFTHFLKHVSGLHCNEAQRASRPWALIL